MIVHGRNPQLDVILRLLAEALDIPPELDRQLTDAYEDLGRFLANGAAERFRASAEVYPQGSRRLGTLTRPVKEGADYDVDLVYRRDIERTSTTQVDLKESAGEQLREYVKQHRRLHPARALKLREGCRCWTLEYTDFHLDVLPAIPNNGAQATQDSILITDRDLSRWQQSNPRGYAAWFQGRTEFEMEREKLAKSLGAKVETVPDHHVRTPLHRVVQLLKRHRDLVYDDDPDSRPASIIITTLAAHAYDREPDVESALRGVLERFEVGIQRIGDRWSIPNPVDQNENFADRWNQHPERQRAFRAWLDRVKGDLLEVRAESGFEKIAEVLKKSFGATPVIQAMTKLGQGARTQRENGRLFICESPTLSDRGSLVVPPHRFYGSKPPIRRR